MSGPEGGPEVRFDVRLTPRAAFDRVDGVADGALRVRVSAPPVDEAANRSLVRLLGRELGIPPSAVRISAGRRLAPQDGGRDRRRPGGDPCPLARPPAMIGAPGAMPGSVPGAIGSVG